MNFNKHLFQDALQNVFSVKFVHVRIRVTSVGFRLLFPLREKSLINSYIAGLTVRSMA